ncbi:unnamed protein product [Schistocephalus solidus]|uniref:COesterase domain-containing protein n=1 Tax=Schistocephalus solidus TaxID=70667 RepID=A0A183SA11_SCHSO|nr:unnamed protein product [Schistocephalus solidus]
MRRAHNCFDCVFRIRPQLANHQLKPSYALFNNFPTFAHKCTSDCLHALKNPDDPSVGVVSESPFDYKGLNPLEIPIRAGWLSLGPTLYDYFVPSGYVTASRLPDQRRVMVAHRRSQVPVVSRTGLTPIIS